VRHTPSVRRRLLLTLPLWPVTAGHAQPVLLSLAMPGLDRARTVRVWLPPGYEQGDERYPVLYLHDGQNLAGADAPHGGWAVDQALAALPHAIVVGIDHGGLQRVTELNPWSNSRFGPGEGLRYLRFISETVKPRVDARLRTRPQREHTAIGGSSLGGLVSLAALHFHAPVFGAALVLSPAFWIAPEIHALPFEDVRVFQSIGTGEGERHVAEARRMHEALRTRRGVECRLDVVPGATHDERAWRAVMPRALRWWLDAGEALRR
jgi:predicted alpha/beta superfamily hydrolase